MSLTLRNTLFCILVLCLGAYSASAQLLSAPPQARPHSTPPPPDPVDQEQFVAYWTSETGWTSELQLRNNTVGHDLIVTPVLRLADGTETTLAPATIAAASAPQFIGTYGSVALRPRAGIPSRHHTASA